jgi:signal transduction histidine kinase/CheY-like chemotaxis protein
MTRQQSGAVAGASLMQFLSLVPRAWSLSPSLKSWVVRLWLLSCFAAMLASSWAMQWLAPVPQSHPSVHWQETRALWLEPRLPQASEEVVVSLPDSWKARGLPAHGLVRYTTRVDLQDPQALRYDEPWALRVDHLCSEHRIRINDDLLATTDPELHMRGKMLPMMVNIPTRMLKPGTNTLTIDVSCVIQGGISSLALAPQRSLQGGFDNRQLFTIMLPLAMNVAGMAFGLFLLMLWWFRAENRAIGLMGVVTLVASIRNCSYYVLADLAWNPSVVTWLHFAAHTVVTTLFGLSALGLTNTRWEAYRKTLVVVLWTFPVIGLAALPFDSHLFAIRGTLQVVLIVLSVPSLWILLRASHEWRMVSIMAFTLGAVAMAAATLRDYILIRFIGDPTAMYWTAVSFPLSLPGLYLVMAERYTKALEDVERANQTLEQRVQERTADLESANAAKGHFLAAASHDLRQPMVAIGLITGLLRDRIKEPELHSLTSRLSEAVESMEDLLSRLLDLSRLEAGAIDLKPQRVALQPLFDAIVAHENETAKAKGIAISMHAPHAAVWCDPMLLEQVIRNLVGNAVRYTRQGRVLVCARRRAGNWLIQVWDTGVGIAEQDQRRIFEDFVQLNNPGRNLNGGLGLGLALVQRAARLMGTQVHVRSRLGHGSCFSIVLPVAGRPRQALPAGPSTAILDSDTPLAHRHIVLLEDDQAVRLALERRLQAWGAQVSSTASLGELRLLLAESTDADRPHLLLTDLSLGDGDGLQAKDEVRQRWPGLPVVIVTGDTAPARLQALADSGTPVLHKPFKLDELLRTLIEAR